MIVSPYPDVRLDLERTTYTFMAFDMSSTIPTSIFVVNILLSRCETLKYFIAFLVQYFHRCTGVSYVGQCVANFLSRLVLSGLLAALGPVVQKYINTL